VQRMKPRPVKFPSAGMGRSSRPQLDAWSVDEPTTLDEDPQSKTPVVPAPTLWMLAHAGASWYSRYRFLLIGIGVALVIAVAFLLGLRGSSVDEPDMAPPLAAPPPARPAPARPEAQPIAPPAPVVAVPAVPETIVLSVTVSPANAIVLIDGEQMPSNPFTTRFPRSAATHRVRATAPGYTPKERLVSFADNVMLDLSLIPIPADPPAARERTSSSASKKRERERERDREREAARPSAPPPAPPPAAVASPPAPAAAPAESPPRTETEKPRRRRIDSNDPYAEDRR
jgi:hypothetical protein